MNWKQEVTHAIFYSDSSKESDEARRILNETSLIIEEVKKSGDVNGSLNGYRPPLVRAKEGEFEGVSRIKEFVEYRQSLIDV